MSSDGSPVAMLEALRARFRARCENDLRILEQGPDGEAFRYCVHRLAGSAGTFGFDDISRSAAQIDDLLQRQEMVEPELLDDLIRRVRAIL
ncbi:MAG: Hpt domain-containing protein [Alphaproteobacteria bacterium]|nr:Hpt domain-containing protein [Alphaproteobacteria bacterium]